MNASPALLLLLLFLLSPCLGKGQDDSLASGNVLTKKMQEESDNMATSCPAPADIEPCECTNPDYPVLDCSNVLDEDQLREVFKADFPSKNLFKFLMRENKGLKVLEDGVFGDVTFEILEISWLCAIETVSNDALTPSFTTLRDIIIENCQLSTFPFERLAEFTSLTYLSLRANKILSVPPLSSSSLTLLHLGSNDITRITPDTFTNLPNIDWILINSNYLAEITPGTFKGLPGLWQLILSGNEFRRLESYAFDLVHKAPKLDLSYNHIDFVEVDTFKGVTGNATIDLGHNVLTTLEEEVWRPVLEQGITILLAGNDLTCGCDVAWLVRNPQLLGMTQAGVCLDGTPLTDLDPVIFNNCN